MILPKGKYYLYKHISSDKGDIFYIGIGTKPKVFNTHKQEYNRAFSKSNKGNFWKNFSKKYGYSVEVVLESDNYEFIKKKEIEFIRFYGRRDLGKGLLCNMTDGGEGLKGVLRTNEWNKKISIANTGKPCSTKGIPCSEERREKTRKSNLGKKRSEATKLAVRKARLKQDMSFLNKSVEKLDKDGTVLQTFKNIKDAALATNQKSDANISAVCKNKRNLAGGFKWKYKN